MIMKDVSRKFYIAGNIDTSLFRAFFRSTGFKHTGSIRTLLGEPLEVFIDLELVNKLK